MEAIEMVALIMFALLVGFVVRGMWNAHTVIEHWKNEANEWRRQVDDERTRR